MCFTLICGIILSLGGFMNNKENLELKKESKELESQKRKIEVLKALKNSAKIGHLIAPYAISAGITFGFKFRHDALY